MEYTNMQIDFVKRTQQNLHYVAQHGIEDQKDFNEVTNLINNMIGLVCYPKEAKDKNLSRLNTPLANIQYKHKYGDVYLCVGRDGHLSNSIDDIVRHLRNSICHGYFIQGKNDGNGEIAELRFQDFNLKGDKRFDMVMSVEQLRELVKEISEHYLSTWSNRC